MNNEEKLSKIIKEKLFAHSSTSDPTLSIEDCRSAAKLAVQSSPIDDQYLAPICDEEVLSYPFLIQCSLMKDITCKVVKKILNERLKSDKEELRLLEIELSNQNKGQQEFSKIESLESMINQYNLDIKKQKEILREWQNGNFSKCAEEIKIRVFEYKKGTIFQEEVKKELIKYVTLLDGKNVQSIFEKFKDILHIDKKVKIGIGVINKIVEKSAEIAMELEVDQNTQNLDREYSKLFEVLSSMFMIVSVPFFFSYYTSALAVTRIFGPYTDYQYLRSIRKKVQDIVAELDADYKNHFKQDVEKGPSNELAKPKVQTMNNTQKLEHVQVI